MADSDDPSSFLAPALRQLARGATLNDFCAWFGDAFGPMLLPGARARVSDQAAAPDEARRAAMVLARQLWRVTPDPARGWNARNLPQPGRNDPCYCGSGRKYKQCCQALVADLPPMPLDPIAAGGLLFAEGPAAWRTPQALRAMPPDMLASAAAGWRDAHGDTGVIQLLEPLFLAPAGLGARHEQACDMLADAMLAQGLDARREHLARTLVAKAGHRRLRSVGHSRLAVMLSDRGDFDSAWKEVQAARREDADNPELLHLEMTLLLAQDRQDEAIARAPLLAARARKLGFPDLAELLPELAERGLAAVARDFAEDDLEPFEEEWQALLREPLAHLDPQRFARLHTVKETGGELQVAVAPVLKRPLAAWRRRYGATPGTLTALDGSADALLDEAPAARDWLRTHPDCALAVPVLDDLLIAARAMVAESASMLVAEAAAELGAAVAGMLAAASQDWPQAPLPWMDTANRPLLRVMSQAIALAFEMGEDERAVEWMRWMLARNPTDNHGWRELMRIDLLRRGEAEAALALLDAYPDDMPPSEHERALALYLLRRWPEAESVLRSAHAAFPAFVAALLPETLDRPAQADAGLREFGGSEMAWDWRARVRDLWHASGALEWARGLDLTLAPARRRKPAKARPRAPAKARAAAALPAPATDPLQVLRGPFGERLPWLLGWLAGVAWAPAGVATTQWVVDSLQQAQDLTDVAAANALVGAIMDQHNAFNSLRLDAAAGAAVPLPIAALDPGDDAGWIAFSAGFVQLAETHTAGAWRAAGASLAPRQGPWEPLRQLAALAPAAPDGWRATDDRNRPLLGVADAGAPAFDMLRHALQPLWELALKAR